MIEIEKPRIERVESSESYGKFVVEPLEHGFGQTLGNSLRRVLLSSLPGVAVSSIRIEGIQHEFSAVPGVKEDVAEIILNLKELSAKLYCDGPKTVSINVKGPCELTAAALEVDDQIEVVNRDLHIATLNEDADLIMHLTLEKGRGYVSADKNKNPNMPIGVIPIDSIFSPVTRVKYAVDNARVGQMTEFDKLVLDIWTDGRVSPGDAMLQAASIMRHHLDEFVDADSRRVEFDKANGGEQDANTAQLRKLLNMSVNEIELSVRAANCLNNANITTVGQLAMKTESEMLKYRNFGKKSLNEIKDKLVQHGLSLGMQFDAKLLASPAPASRMRDISDEARATDLQALISHNIDAFADDEDDE